ncbi:MAG: hypothetical protein QXY40_04970 [Candidatus Methanomethylicia archaeon]
MDIDVDVFIMFNTLKGIDVRTEAYSIIANHVGRALTIVDARLNELHGELTPLAINIASDEIIVYGKLGEVERFIDHVRKVIDELKLIRYRTPRKVWMEEN